MLESSLDLPSSTLGDQPENWRDAFLDDSQNIIISFPQDAIEENNDHFENTPPIFDTALLDEKVDYSSEMDWVTEKPQTIYQVEAWEHNSLYATNSIMTPQEKLQMYSNSSRIQHRIQVAREILPTLESLTDIEEAIQYVLPIIDKVATDTDPDVREIIASNIDRIILYFYKYSPPKTNSSSPLDTSISPAIQPQHFCFLLTELLLDQNTIISSLGQQGIVNVTKALVSNALDGDNEEQWLALLDQEIVQGVLIELYAIAEGRKWRNVHKRTFTLINNLTNSERYIDHGELQLSKMACLSLISALAQFLGYDHCTSLCLSIIESLTQDGLFYVRKEAIHAIGNIAHYVDPTVVINRLVPLYQILAGDNTWHVRNSCILALPTLCEVLPHEEKSQLVVNSVSIFMNDPSHTVRFTLAEMIGEVISKFLPYDWETTGKPGNVPEMVIYFFLSLGENTHHQPTQDPIENNCTLVCAHNFPAVLLTAGAIYWESHFKGKYMRLAKDHQVKTRSSFAHSLHAIAKIIGPERTDRDLVRIFALYLMDVDEVKSGIMEHLAAFLEALSTKCRCEYLPVLMEIWEGVAINRYLRETLVSQLIFIIPLCTLDQVIEHVLPLVIRACQDEIAIIRDTAVNTFPAILELLKQNSHGFSIPVNQLVNSLSILSESSGYRQRLLFANIGHILLSNGLSFEAFTTYLLDLLLPLANDSVINVRIATSRCLSTLFGKVRLSCIGLQQKSILSNQKLLNAIQYLEADIDMDIRHYMDKVNAVMKSISATTKSSSSIVYQQQQQQVEDLLTELPSPPCSPNKKSLSVIPIV
ncbi:armadillo-type protein [Halteromyces radiatus]|uniref:armadillo-type protein n=1 Tax=Halteromyces radiatus TaxID=101107 RepID=UPI00221E53C6|nr:armadillo-type protein [Halteromyces radiatus]KAI8093223.1 armadillo-type protein [Halteromyces radiatus]